MYTKRLLKLMICSLLFISSYAQVKESAVEVDLHSLTLYNGAQWKELVVYGKDKISSGVDFPLLRMRMGYAAFMLGNYSQSLVQYKKVYDAEPTNETALYYVYLNNLYLNNINESRYFVALMSEAARNNLGVKKIKLESIETEFSYKSTTSSQRNDAQYYRLGFNTQLGYRLSLQQSGAMYNQVISESLMPTTVTNRTNIDIQQKEYYGKLNFALTGKISLFGGYHYLYTPFNNLIYNNSVAFGGIAYTAPYFHIKAMATNATITDNSYTQYDASVALYPLGNTKFYTISKGSYNTSFIFTQIAGFKAAKKIWLEGNITIGEYDTFIDNDGLFVYNDIDKKQFKAGGSIYASLSKHLLLTVNYNFEQKLKYKTTGNDFYQHSTTGGLQWKF